MPGFARCVAAVLLALSLAVAWAIPKVSAAAAHLREAEADARALRGSVTDGDRAGFERFARDFSLHASEADAATRQVAWTAAEDLPVVGSALRSIRGIAAAADGIAVQTLPALSAVDAAAGRPDLLSAGRVDLPAVAALTRVIGPAARAAGRWRAALTALPGDTVSGSVDKARREAIAGVAKLAATLGSAERGGQILPALLGAAGRRRYFVALQTNAEARGTGGVVGLFAVISVDHGAIHLDRVAGDDELRSADGPVVSLGAEFAERYGDAGSNYVWPNSNLSPNFPYAARIWTALWRHQHGTPVSGAVATDPVALGDLLASLGPRDPSSRATGVPAKDFATFTERNLYVLVKSHAARHRRLVREFTAAFHVLLGARRVNLLPVLRALGAAAADRRFLVWSGVHSEEASIAETVVGGVLPQGGQSMDLVVNNASGNKLDAYLSRRIVIASPSCGSRKDTRSVSVTLTSDAPSHGLAAIVGARYDLPTAQRPSQASEKLFVELFAPGDATTPTATIDARPVPLAVSTERGHPVYRLAVILFAASHRKVEFRFAQPPGSNAGPMAPQPLLEPETITQTAGCPTTG